MNDKKILLAAIKETGLLAQSKIVWVVHPLLEEMATKLAGYVGPYALTENGKPLLEYCLKDAFSRYKREADASHGDRAAIAQFAKALIDCSKEVFAQELVAETPGGDVQWMPFVCGAGEFLAKFPKAKVTNTRVVSKISNDIASAFMMTKIVPYALLDTDSLAELFNDMKVTS